MKKYITKLLSIFIAMVVFNIPTAMAAEFVYTPMKFTYPVDISFAIEIIGAASWNTSMTTEPGNATELLDFNATTADDKLVNPCREGSGDCQTYGADPALKVRNDGNVQLNITVYGSNITGRMGATKNYQVQVNVTNCTADTPAYTILVANETVIGATPATNITLVGWFEPNNVTCVWLFANFSGAPGGSSSEYLNWSSVGNETGA